jgi:hypothetical protein
MTLKCPVCGAEGNRGEACRRCKADLALVWAAARAACAALARRDFAAAWQAWRRLNEPRPK